MPVQFVLGRAGSGKTHRCIEQIRSQLRLDALHGPHLILLVPEQASLQMERMVLAADDVTCAHRVEVLSFKRLAFRVLESVGAIQRRALSESARIMVLRYVAQQLRPQLQFYKHLDRHSGFLQHLALTMTELIEESVSVNQLKSINHEDSTNAAQSAKLHDICLLYEAYLSYLGEDRVDPSQYLDEARLYFDQVPWLDHSQVWVDGFASFSGQEQAALISLATRAAHMELTVLCDPQSISQIELSAFGRTIETMRKIERAFEKNDIQVEPPMLLQAATQPRFNKSAMLAKLESRFFDSDYMSDPKPMKVSEELDVVRLPNRRSEVDYAVSKIHAWVNQDEKNRRYKDIAIIVRELTHYEDLLRSALSSRGIPFFIDRRRSVIHHPLVNLFRVGVQLAADDFSTATVCDLFKSDLLPLAYETLDELENYCLARAVHGWKAWQQAWTAPLQTGFLPTHDHLSVQDQAALDRVNMARSKVVDALAPWMDAITKNQSLQGYDWAAALLAWMRHLHVDETLSSWVQQAEANGNLELASEHRQIWRDLLAFLDDLTFTFKDIELSIQDFVGVIDVALSSMTLGLTPPMVDQVLIGSIERSRHPHIEAAILLGFNDGIFPQSHKEDPILNDDDRHCLQSHGVDLRPASTQRIVDESLLAYIALTRPTHSLIVSCAASDHNGKPLRPSPYMETICQCCGVTLREENDPMQSRLAWQVMDVRDFLNRLPLELRCHAGANQDDKVVRDSWMFVYDWIRQQLLDDPWPAYAFSGLDEQAQSNLGELAVASIHSKPLRTSVSQLESFATCPFQHFGRYRLGLKERVISPLADVDVGRLHHAILEDFVKDLAQAKESFSSKDEEVLLRDLRQTHERLSVNMLQAGAVCQSRDRYLIQRAESDLSRVVTGQYRRARAGMTTPNAAELAFGMDADGSLPALNIITPTGKKVWLRGYIDRVDIAELGDELLGIVVDYKRTRDKKLDLSSAYHGLSLQLLAYLLVLAEHGQTLTGRPIRPVAALYVSLMPKYTRVDHPHGLSQREAVLGGNYMPRGLILADKFKALDANTEASGWSDYYAFYRSKSGEPGHLLRSDAANAEDFQGMLHLTKRRLGELADDLYDGCIKIKPVRMGTFSPCSWCTMKSVCRFEIGLHEPRYLEHLPRNEVFQKARDMKPELNG